MSENRTNWNGFSPDVFGPQPGPTNATEDSGTYPVCQRQQQRIFSLENILYGLEFVVTPLLQALANSSDPAKLYDETEQLTMTGGADILPAGSGAGAFLKVSIYNLSTNAIVTISKGQDFRLEPGVSMDLNTQDPESIQATGTAGQAIQLIYTYLLP